MLLLLFLMLTGPLGPLMISLERCNFYFISGGGKKGNASCTVTLVRRVSAVIFHPFSVHLQLLCHLVRKGRAVLESGCLLLIIGYAESQMKDNQNIEQPN